MLQNQNVIKISELQGILNNKSATALNISDVFKDYKVCKALQNINKYKVKGIAVIDILTALLLLPFFLEETINGMIKSSVSLITAMQKDTLYRLKNNDKIDWRKILLSTFKRSQKIINRESIEPDKPSNDIISKVKCLVFDDTTFCKTGFKIEGIGKVYDHVSNAFNLGFKMLGCCFWDGKSLNPIDFSLHSERGKKKKNREFHPFGLTNKQLKNRYTKKRKTSTPGNLRKKELRKSKITVMKEMLQRAVHNKIIPDYVLMDKWFISEELINFIRNLSKGHIHVIAACKKDRRKYTYRGKLYNAQELLRMNIDKRKHCRSMKMSYISILVEYKGIPLRLYFNKPRNRRHWELLVTTDIKLSFIDTLKIYRLRWGIEVFFKESKQLLLLGKCQSRDFDAHIADITLSMMRYILLNQRKRFNAYETLGEVFKDTRLFTLELTIGQRLWLLFIEICCQLFELFDMDEDLFMVKLFSIPEFEEIVFYCLEKKDKSKIEKIDEDKNVV